VSPRLDGEGLKKQSCCSGPANLVDEASTPPHLDCAAPSRCFALYDVSLVFGTALLIPNGITVRHGSRTPYSAMNSSFIVFITDEDLARKPILDSQSKPIQGHIFRVPPVL
jgi:hypothetical protein